jgi:hypothetical protein
MNELTLLFRQIFLFFILWLRCSVEWGGTFDMSPVEQIPDQIPVGALACQKDTFLKTTTTKCIGCSGKPDKKGFYEVLLHDTSRFYCPN